MSTAASPEDSQLRLDVSAATDPWIRPGLRPVIESIRSKQHRVLFPDCDGFVGTLRGYQHDGVAMMYLTPRLCLGDVTGAGKTVQSLRYLVFLRDQGELTRHRPAVVAVPPNALDSTWMADGFEVFNAPPSRFVGRGGPLPSGGLSVVDLSGEVTPRDRREVYRLHHAQVILITYNTLLRDYQHLMEAYPDGFATVLTDEGSMFKNHGTLTAETVKLLGARAPRSNVLTATPVQTKLLDFHSILEAMQLGRIFGSAKTFDDRYSNYVVKRWRRPGGEYVSARVRDSHSPYILLDELRERLWPYYFRRSYSDIGADMPALTFSTQMLDMAPAQRRLYDEVQRRELPPPGPGRRFQLQQRARYLKEIATGTQTFMPDAPDISPKLDWLVDHVMGDWSTGGWDGNPVKVVSYSSAKLTIITLMRRLGLLGIDAVVMAGPGDAPGPTPFPFGLPPSAREPLRQRFLTDPACRVLVGTSAIEMSLNFPVSPVMVNIDLPTNPARLTQLAGRIWRQNSKYRFVHVVNLMMRHTVEVGLFHVLRDRQQVIDQLNGEPSEMFASLSEEDLVELVTRRW